jgi:hypothetical protein
MRVVPYLRHVIERGKNRREVSVMVVRPKSGSWAGAWAEVHYSVEAGYRVASAIIDPLDGIVMAANVNNLSCPLGVLADWMEERGLGGPVLLAAMREPLLPCPYSSLPAPAPEDEWELAHAEWARNAAAS